MKRTPDMPRHNTLTETIQGLRAPHPDTEQGWLRVYDDATAGKADYPSDTGVEVTTSGVRGVFPTFKNNWQNVGDPYAPAGFHIAKDGEVRFRGHIRGGTVGQYAFMLPIGYRPEYDMTFIVPVDSGGFARIRIAASSGHVFVDSISAQG